jgi:hypothetical protein
MPETPPTPEPKQGAAEAPPKPAKAAPAPRKRRPPPSPLSVITAALGLFFVVLTLLAIQVRNGRDPALGPGPAVPGLTQPAAKGGTKAAEAQATGIVTRTSPVPPP